jgi:hypothetical protein
MCSSMKSTRRVLCRFMISSYDTRGKAITKPCRLQGAVMFQSVLAGCARRGFSVCRGDCETNLVGARGFEPPPPWSRTEGAENLKPCIGVALTSAVALKSCLSWSTVGTNHSRRSPNGCSEEGAENVIQSAASFACPANRVPRANQQLRRR